MSPSNVLFVFWEGGLMAKGISLNKKKGYVSFWHLPFLTFTSQVADSDGSESPMSFLA